MAAKKTSNMQLTILSDIHDHVWNLQKALATRAVQETDALLCCGDLCAPFIIRLLGQGYPDRPVHIVLGNNDGDVAGIIRVAHDFPHIHIHGEYFRGEFDGKTLAMNHYPDKARLLAETQAYDVVCYGHNHEISTKERAGNTLLINPGTLMGYHGGKLTKAPVSFVVLDTDEPEPAEYYL